MKKTILTLFPILVAAFAFAGTVKESVDGESAAHAEPRILSEISSTEKSKMTPEERRNVSLAGARILKHVNQARKAVQAEDNTAALEHVDKGLLLVDIIEKVRPSYEVVAKISSGDLVYEDKEEVRASVIPLYEELDDVTVIYPVFKASQDAAEEVAAESESDADSKTEDNEKEESKPKLESLGYVADADLDYTSVKMNISRATRGLKAAKRVLSVEKDVDFADADAALAAVQSSVIFEYVEVDQPLQKARTNLGLAKSFFESGDKRAAKVALAIASDSLQIYGGAAAEHRSNEVEELKKEIDELIEKIDEADDNDAAEKATGWWEKVRSWFD